MASFNRVVLVGNLTRDPELRHIPSGMAVTDLGLAINDRRKSSSGEWVEETTYVDVTMWARQAEVACQYLRKGSSVLIEGRLKMDSWETNDGQKRTKLKVTGERMQMLGGRDGDSGSSGRGGSQSRSSSGGDDYQQDYQDYDSSPGYNRSSSAPDDEIPF
ncbi:Single-stranded DNA-binding protein [Planctomycetales bacterium 10988]|nr:Single-stranded DNA-binding protein [Planctomycetales bacterium 10988]